MRIGRDIAEQLAKQLIKPLPNNFVERPWGGTRLREFKNLCALPEQSVTAGAGLGEAFEISAYNEDAEASRFPSKLRIDSGAVGLLPELLEDFGELLLGGDFVRRFDNRFPLLPKILSVKELLSVQGHPAGNTEVYVILDAEPGATIRVGFQCDVDRHDFRRKLTAGLENQRALLGLLEEEVDQSRLHGALSGWFASRDLDVDRALDALEHWRRSRASRVEIARLLSELRASYWYVLDLMNEIEVEPGQVIYNANPPRIVAAAGRPATAEVHALGNTSGKEVLALEIRRPGPTFRAWDNVRFPMRDIDIDAALDVLNLRRTEPAEFLVERQPVSERTGVSVSVESQWFRIEHLAPSAQLSVDVPSEGAHCLHAIEGRVRAVNARGESIGTLTRGESALVPAAVGAYSLASESSTAEIVKVSLL
jgi:mannose-6-phosphate isomerase class I